MNSLPLAAAHENASAAVSSVAFSGSDETCLLMTDIDNLATPVPVDRIERFSFTLDDVPYSVIREKEDGGEHRMRITATLGYLPFTAQSAEKRQALLEILAASRALPQVKFGLDMQSRIIVTCVCSAETMVRPDFLFYPLTQFMQEARPFIELIGRNL